MSAHTKAAATGASAKQGAPEAAENNLSWKDVQGSPLSSAAEPSSSLEAEPLADAEQDPLAGAEVCEAEVIDDDADLEFGASDNGEHHSGSGAGAEGSNGEHHSGNGAGVEGIDGEHHSGSQDGAGQGGVEAAGKGGVEQGADGQNSQPAGGSHEGVPSEDETSKAEPAKLLEVAQAQVAEMKDKYLRLQAEWDNFRKRTNAQRDSERMLAAENLVTDILPILDDLERAVAHAKESGEGGSLTDGVEAVQTKLLQILAKHNVSQIDALGKPFDATRHQAVGTKEDTSVPEESVVEVYQQGYEMADKVIRPAMVLTSTGGPAQPAKEA